MSHESTSRRPRRRAQDGRSILRGLLAGLLVAVLLAPGAFAQEDLPRRRKPLRPMRPSGIETPRLMPPTLPSPEALSRLPIDAEVRELVDHLGSDRYEVREQATDRLLDEAFDQRQLFAMLAVEPLDAEQRHRLVEVIRYRAAAPRGAVGISMQARPADPGQPIEIDVVNVIAGLPAERVLQAGDRIFEVDNLVLFSEDDLVQRVQTRRPGDSVMVGVRRVRRNANGAVLRDIDDRPVYEELRFELTLGATSQLVKPGQRSKFRKSEFVRLREHEAYDAIRNFGPRPEPLVMETGQGGVFEPGPEMFTDADVEHHPALITLAHQRRYLAINDQPVDPKLRAEWERRLRDLIEQLPLRQDEAERLYLQRVIERYRELMEE